MHSKRVSTSEILIYLTTCYAPFFSLSSLLSRVLRPSVRPSVTLYFYRSCPKCSTDPAHPARDCVSSLLFFLILLTQQHVVFCFKGNYQLRTRPTFNRSTGRCGFPGIAESTRFSISDTPASSDSFTNPGNYRVLLSLTLVHSRCSHSSPILRRLEF